ncbi:hypothetical protein K435DRAFT_197225 [Dendrothele bispora CBS 962.96]|uniref:Uncharacterized protein n=1 Tax=Dendrothele bispora (strain CBS 962.96) TaxID=1314807 RepID=A0A4S8LUY4_DENBC|nr:hypothetical protein K435DRAFT_197225 [Dendrothele bispora CBS 962.96]
MTFMLSSLRVSNTMQNDENVPQPSGKNKRKSVSLLPSGPAKQLKRIGRFSSLLSTSSSSACSSGHGYDGLAARKSPPTCTISLENVTVINSIDLRTSTNVKTTHMSMDCDMPPSIMVKEKQRPLEVVNVNVIPFPSESSVSEPDVPVLGHPPGLPGSSMNARRRRSSHLPLKPQSSSPAVKKHRRSHVSISISKRAPLSPISLADTESGGAARSDVSRRKASPPPLSRRGDVKFTALVRRSVLVGLVERDHHQSQVESGVDMDVDMDGTVIFGHRRSESVTLDILNDEADATLAYQDQLLVDRLGKLLADCGYRESYHQVSLLPLSVEPRRPASPVLSVVSTSMTIPSSPDLDPFAFDPVGNRPSSPIPPLEPVTHSSPNPSEPIPIPAIRRSSPPLSSSLSSHRPSSPRSTDPASKILTPPQLVATLVLRHRDRAAIRPRRSFDDSDGPTSVTERKRSPLACEAVTSNL